MQVLNELKIYSNKQKVFHNNSLSVDESGLLWYTV